MVLQIKKCILSGVVVVSTVSLLGLVTLVRAEVFNVDGYKIDVQCKYSRKKSRLKSTGNIKGGQECRKLNVGLRFTNGKEMVSGEKTIENYKPTAEGTTFVYKEKYVTTSGKKRQSKVWRPCSVKVRCAQ